MSYERVLALAVAVLTFSHGARAARSTATSALELDWSAEPACSTGAAAALKVERLLQDAPGTQRSVAARVVISRRADQSWHVSLLTRAEGATEARAFDAESCEAAEDAVSLMLAIAVNPQLSVAASPAGEAAAEPLPAAPAPVAKAPAEPAASAASPIRVVTDHALPERKQTDALWATASVAGDAGTLPRAGAGALFTLGWQRAHAWLELSGTYWGGQSATVAGGRTGASFRLWSVQARAVYGLHIGSISVGPLLSAGLEHFNAQGFHGAVSNFERSASVPVVGAGAALTWRPAGPLLLRLGAEGLLLATRPSFVVLNDPAAPESVYEPARVAARASLGAGFCFF